METALTPDIFYRKLQAVFIAEYGFVLGSVILENPFDILVEGAEAHIYKEKNDPDLADEAGAIEEMFEHYETLGFLGGMLYQNGEPVAFTAGTKLDDEVFDTHFEKALPGVEGAYTMVNREFARLVKAEYPDIAAFNREEDMGIEGLRKAKLSYHPDILLMKYFAIEK